MAVLLTMSRKTIKTMTITRTLLPLTVVGLAPATNVAAVVLPRAVPHPPTQIAEQRRLIPLMPPFPLHLTSPPAKHRAVNIHPTLLSRRLLWAHRRRRNNSTSKSLLRLRRSIQILPMAITQGNLNITSRMTKCILRT